MPRRLMAILSLVCTAFFACFLIWPLLAILQGGFLDADGALTFAYLKQALSDPIYLEGLLNAFALGVASTLVAFLLGLPLAVLSDRYTFPGKPLLTGLILIPLVLPPFVGAIGIRQIFGEFGALNALLIEIGLIQPEAVLDWLADFRFWGIVAVNGLSLFPLIYLNASAALANVDPSLLEASANLGSVGLRRFRRVTLPLIGPGLFAGGTIVFIWSFTELGVPLIFDYNRVTPVQIFHGIKDLGGNPFPYALVAVMLALALALYALGKFFFGRKAYAMMARATSAAAPRPPGRPGAWACTAVFAAVSAVALLPHLGVILVSFSSDWYGTVLPGNLTLDNYRLALGHDLTASAVANSLRFASLSTMIDLVLGVAIAYLVVRTRAPGRHLLDLLSMLPLAIPGLVLAFGYLAMTREGRFFAFLDPVENPTFLLIIAYAVRRLPYVVRSVAAGLQQTSVTLEEAARSVGCPPLKAALRITLPLISANLLAGGIMAFAFAMLEVSDSLLLAQKQAFYPITKAIFELYQWIGDGRFFAAALGVWAMLFLGMALLGLSLLLGRRLGALFRV